MTSCLSALKSRHGTYGGGVLVGVHANPGAQKQHQSAERSRAAGSKLTAPHGMLMKVSMGVVPPPQTQTVKKTMSRVVENIICRA